VARVLGRTIGGMVRAQLLLRIFLYLQTAARSIMPVARSFYL